MEEDAGSPATGANVGPLDGVLGVALLPVVVVEQPEKRGEGEKRGDCSQLVFVCSPLD